MQAYLPQHTTLCLKVKALKARVHSVYRQYSTIETETETLVMMLMKKVVYLAYINTAHTTNCMDIYILQHIVLHAVFLLVAGILSRPRGKCVIIYFVTILCHC